MKKPKTFYLIPNYVEYANLSPKVLKLRLGRKRLLKGGNSQACSFRLRGRYRNGWGQPVTISKQIWNRDCHISITRNKKHKEYLILETWGPGWISSIGFRAIK